MDEKREQAVLDAVDSRVAQDKDFTAYLITQMVRSRYPGADVPHAEVRQLVHDLYNAAGIAGYTREIAEGIPGKPWRYLPAVQDDEEGEDDDDVSEDEI